MFVGCSLVLEKYQTPSEVKGAAVVFALLDSSAFEAMNVLSCFDGEEVEQWRP